MSTSAAPPRRPAQANTSWWWALLIWSVTVAVTVGAVQLFLQWNHTWSPNGRQASFDALTPIGRWSVRGTVLAMWLGGTAWIARATRRRILTAVVAAALLGGSIIGGRFAGGRGLFYSTWDEHDRVTAADGREYMALSQRDVMDRFQAIGRVRRPGAITECIELVRGVEPYTGYSGYVMVPNDMEVPIGPFIVALPQGGVAYLEREPGVEAVAIVCADSTNGDVHRLGPFALFEANDQGDPNELDRWSSWVAESHWRLLELDDRELDRGLAHPSPWVRAAAARLMDAVDRRSPSKHR